MNIISFLTGILAGGILVWVVMRMRNNNVPSGIVARQKKQHAEKENRKAHIITYLNKHERITNNEAETLLGIADATATKYLQELEDEEKIRQIGKEGKSVYYEIWK
jgi:predicted HTH transcriptional regulator